MLQLTTIRNWLGRRAEEALALILASLFLTFLVQIAFRYFLNLPLGWTVEYVSIAWLWGILFVIPLIREQIGPAASSTLGQVFPLFRQTNPSGYGVLAGGFVLAVMAFPLIVAVVEEVLRSVPQQMRETLLALGATRWETTRCIVRHVGLPGILAAVVLGFSRAFGETLAVMMVVGNVPRSPTSLFDGAYPLPALIANTYSEMMSVPLYDSALMTAALILLAVVMFFNVLARLVINRLVKKGGSI